VKVRDVVAGARGFADALAGLEIVGDPQAIVSSVVCDSREVTPGSLFCCMPGATRDGHDFARAAVGAGARVLLVERPLDEAVTQIVVHSTTRAVGPVAASFHGHPSRDIAVFGVTGTNGKTTTTFLLDAIAAAAGAAAGIIGTVGTRYDAVLVPAQHTTPDACTLQTVLDRMHRSGVAIVAMEVSSHALHQSRVYGTAIRVACFTNLSTEHLDYHGTLDRYRATKDSLFTRDYTETAAINIDDEFGRELQARAARRGLDVWSYSAQSTSDVSASGVVLEANRTRFVLSGDRVDGRHDVDLPLVGAFNVANALAAAATALAGGLPIESIVGGLRTSPVIPGRLEPIESERPFSVFVDYAHTPAAIAQVLSAVRPIAAGGGGRVIVVFGCGGDRDRTKRPLMGRAASVAADCVVVTSDNPRSEDPAVIIDEVLAGIDRSSGSASLVVEPDRAVAIGLALRSARPGDVVVIAGKGHETGQTTRGETVPFDDRLVARAALAGLS
jgi:UDP-N-acetylmuramoyl-L-alanyl-D-glutamate--2,6-diaminopimelate ligase